MQTQRTTLDLDRNMGGVEECFYGKRGEVDVRSGDLGIFKHCIGMVICLWGGE